MLGWDFCHGNEGVTHLVYFKTHQSQIDFKLKKSLKSLKKLKFVLLMHHEVTNPLMKTVCFCFTWMHRLAIKILLNATSFSRWFVLQNQVWWIMPNCIISQFSGQTIFFPMKITLRSANWKNFFHQFFFFLPTPLIMMRTISSWD